MERVGLTDFEKRLLMYLQYEFPYSAPDPYARAAQNLGIDVEELVAKLRELREKGVLKRIGFYLNPRSRRRVVSLIAFKGGDPEAMRRLCVEDAEVTHCYERVGGGEWRLWVVRRANTMEGLLVWASKAARTIGADSFEILEAVRLHRLSVKYDLYRGVSRAGPYTRVVLNPPTPEELGIDPRLPQMLRSLPLEPDPYAAIGSKLGYTREEVARLATLLLDRGVLGDPGAVLDGHRIGFVYNGMIVAWPRGQLSRLCDAIVEMVPEATHIVERRVYPRDTRSTWAPSCYAMVHATSRELLEEVYGRVSSLEQVDHAAMLVSVRDLKPGAER